MLDAAAEFQMVTPLPPARSGIAQYSRDLVTAAGGHWNWSLIAEPLIEGPGTGPAAARDTPHGFDPHLPAIYQVGNSMYHPTAFSWVTRSPGLLVLHDVVLHHGRLADFVRRNKGGDYRRIMLQLYGPAGLDVANAVLRGQPLENLSDYPLHEDFVEASPNVLVHSAYARELVLARVPMAKVDVVPMGVPLPALVDREEARRVLELPKDAFIIASVTHVNPYKRLPVVIRALRRVVQHFPEARLVVAGSVAPGIDLLGLARLYGVENHLHQLGYVSDDLARLIARAADVCVNLRFPSMGETSASLLRLLGAGRPIAVTDDVATSELPRDAVIPVPVDRFEEEVLAEALLLLGQRQDLRERAGDAARQFVEQHHTTQHMLDAYRRAIHRAWGICLPEVIPSNLHEVAPPLRRATRTSQRLTGIDAAVAAALRGSGIGDHAGTLKRVVGGMRELGLHRWRDAAGRDSSMSGSLPIREELLEILACPVCKSRVRLEDAKLVCTGCGRTYRIEDGIPVMLPDEAE
jgi:glycosyltransferase involved in cell wall biosynthesis/uncharacterized protein YbaR (Trm112 family)